MKLSKYIILPIAAALFASSCEKDGEILTLTPPEGNPIFGADKTTLVLSAERANDLAVTFYWNLEALYPTVSNASVQLPYDVSEVNLQFSTDAEFTKPTNHAPDGGASTVQFSVSSLNTIIIGLGCQEARAFDIWTRISAEYEGETYNSDAVQLSVTPYVPDLTKMELRDISDELIGAIYSAQVGAPQYEGLVNFAAWTNFYFLSPQGDVYGSNSSWTPYSISTDTDHTWSNGVAGLSYVGVNIDNETWWQITLPTITVTDGGSTSATLRYSASDNAISGVFTTTENDKELTVGGTGKLYNIESGTTDGDATDYPFTFELTDAGNTFAFKEGTTGNGKLTVATAGTYRLTLDVEEGIWKIEPTEEVVVDYPETVSVYYYWASGFQNNLASTLKATEQGGSTYTGFLYADNSSWTDGISNFRFHAGSDVYSYSSNQYLLDAAGTGNFWFDGSGSSYKYITVDLANLSWTATTDINAVYASGNFNSWSTTANALTYDSSAKTWTGTCTFTDGDYTAGFQIVFDNSETSNWDYIFGGADGKLWSGGTVTVPAAGTYTLTVNVSDMTNPTYELVSAE